MNRLAEDIKRELAVILRELKDPRIHGMLSIVKLDLSNDLSHCKIYISAMEGMSTAKEAVVGLNSASGFIKRDLMARITMRRCPDLKFIADDSIEQSAHLNQLLRKLNEEEK